MKVTLAFVLPVENVSVNSLNVRMTAGSLLLLEYQHLLTGFVATTTRLCQIAPVDFPAIPKNASLDHLLAQDLPLTPFHSTENLGPVSIRLVHLRAAET